jgi:hypothetical protein
MTLIELIYQINNLVSYFEKITLSTTKNLIQKPIISLCYLMFYSKSYGKYFIYVTRHLYSNLQIPTTVQTRSYHTLQNFKFENITMYNLYLFLIR